MIFEAKPIIEYSSTIVFLLTILNVQFILLRFIFKLELTQIETSKIVLLAITMNFLIKALFFR